VSVSPRQLLDAALFARPLEADALLDLLEREPPAPLPLR